MRALGIVTTVRVVSPTKLKFGDFREKPMLDLMRKHAKSWMIKFLIAAIAIVFVFWGAGSFRGRTLSKVATVNEVPISVAEYDETHRRLLERVQQQYKDIMTDELLEAMNLKQQALNQLIDNYIIFQEAEKMGLGVDDQELQRQIARVPYFQVDGHFDKRAYLRALSAMNYSSADFEEIMRRDILNSKMMNLVSGLAKVSEKEALDYFHFSRDRINLEFASFKADRFNDQAEPTQEELTAYFDENKENYRVPEKVKADYMAFRKEDFMDKVDVTEDDIAIHYEDHLSEYQQPEKVKARHILFKLDPKAPQDEVDKIRARAEEVLQKIKAPDATDFAEFAKEYSEGPSAEKGGDLGWFVREDMVEDFSNVAFAMEKGQISDPVRTDYGFHIIKVEDKQPAKTITLDEVRDKIHDTIASQRAGTEASFIAEDAWDEIAMTQDFEGTAKKMGVEIKTTEFFTENAPLPEFGFDQKFNQVVHSLAVGETSPILELRNGNFIAKVVEKKESYLPELKDVREAVLKDLLRKKSMDKAKEEAEAFLKIAQGEGGWIAAEEQTAAPLDTTGPFSRNQPIPKVGGDAGQASDSFNLKTAGQIGPKLFESRDGYFVVRLKEKLPATKEDFDKEKDGLMKSLLSAKSQQYIQQWLTEAKNQADIKIEESFL